MNGHVHKSSKRDSIYLNVGENVIDLFVCVCSSQLSGSVITAN